MIGMNVFYRRIKEIYSDPKYVGLNVILFLAYYAGVYYLIKLHGGIISLSGPMTLYLLYALLVTSSMMMTLAIYSFAKASSRKGAAKAGGIGILTAAAGGFAVSCGCEIPAALSIAAVGVSSAEFVVADNIITRYTPEIIAIAILVNLVFMAYYLNRLQNDGCKTKGRRT